MNVAIVLAAGEVILTLRALTLLSVDVHFNAADRSAMHRVEASNELAVLR